MKNILSLSDYYVWWREPVLIIYFFFYKLLMSYLWLVYRAPQYILCSRHNIFMTAVAGINPVWQYATNRWHMVKLVLPEHYVICRLLIFFSKSTFSKNSFRNYNRVSNNLEPWFHARIQEFSSGGSRSIPQKKALTTFFFFFFFFLVLCLFYRSQMVNFKEIYYFSRFQRGSNIFQGGGGPTFSRGVQLLISHRNPDNLWFSRGVRTPCPPLWIRTWICWSRSWLKLFAEVIQADDNFLRKTNCITQVSSSST